MRNVATYDESGISIDELQKINFIYGVNGSGKTTIANFLNDPDGDLFTSCRRDYKNDLPIKALVYNKGFRELNFGKGSMPGVFTLGGASIEEQKEIEKLQADLIDIRDDMAGKKEYLEKLRKELEETESEATETFWEKVKKNYESRFREAFAGAGLGNKVQFKNTLKDAHQNNKSPLLSLAQLEEKARTIFGKKPVLLPAITEFSGDENFITESHPIWKKKIIGKSDVPIAQLILRLGMNDWVSDGRQFVQEDDATCPFCQEKTVTATFREQLESFFDEAFLEDTGLVKKLAESYVTEAQQLLHQLQGIEEKEKANRDSKLDLENFSATIKVLDSQFQANHQHVRTKMKEPSRVLELISCRAVIDKLTGIVRQANEKIKEHNAVVANYENERAILIKCIWRFVAEEQGTELRKYMLNVSNKEKGISGVENAIVKLETQSVELRAAIREKTKNLTSVQPSIDAINRILRSYGFVNFEIVPSLKQPNYYQIQRQDGSLAEATLSEGEVTFITFLYFFQCCKGSTNEREITADRILVIDDPISSLDSNILFVVSTLIKEIIRDIGAGQGPVKQLILLTHNVYFHKEVSYESGRDKTHNAHFWILRKNDQVTGIQPFATSNPIQNSYELLWRELQSTNGGSFVSVQNTMRRILESYFKILGKMKDDRIILSFPTKEEQEICRSLICWINDGSHCFPDDLYVEQMDDQVARYKKVFRDIFVYTKHEEHYRMMMGIPEVEDAPALVAPQMN